MNGKINADLKSLKFILNKNKSFLLPAIVLLVSIALFFQFVIPQFRVLIAVQKEAREGQLKLETLKANLGLLTNIDEDALDSQLKVLSLALPLNKDFIGILNSVFTTAQRTGVSLGSFSLRIGDISKSENGNSLPDIKLALPIDANIATINNFAEAINKTVPLSEVYSIRVANASSTVNLSFYYKPLGDSGYSEDAPVIPISQKGITLINQLREFQNVSVAPISTSSAVQ